MSTRRLHLTTTDPEASEALMRTQLRASGHRVPTRHGTTTLSARVSLASRDAVRSAARRMGLTSSKLLGMLADQIAQPGAAAPSGGGAQDVLDQIGALLALPPGSRTVEGILIAIGEIGDQIAAEAGEEDDAGPAAGDPLAASPDPVPATANPAALSATDQKRWLDDRAAQRTKRAARSASTPQARGYDRAVKAAQATRTEQARRR